VGTIILLGAIFGRLGTIMGLGDDDDRDRNEATGAQKGSMLIGGRWINLNRMQPIGSLLVLGATIQQSLQREATGGGVVSDIAMASLKQLMQIPSLRGFSDFGKATDDENKLESFTGRMIASFIPAIIKDYKHRAGVMMDAIREHFPYQVKCFEPEGGMFVWCELPKGLHASKVFAKSIKRNVAFVDGSVFFANGGGENTMRLNFTNSTDAAIRTGITRLAEAIQSFL
jgi:hypothetical protein